MRVATTRVNCYSGHTYADRPGSFLWEGVEYKVAAIEKSWQEPGEKHFLIRTKNSKMFKLCYNETQQQWTATELVRR